MKLGWVYHHDFLEHDTGPFHPERPDRLRAIIAAFEKAGILPLLEPVTFEPAGAEALQSIHEPAYLELVRTVCSRDIGFLGCLDTPVSPRSFEVARLATGGVISACDAVMEGEIRSAFCALRPPGHHAESQSAMGFCLFNHVAVAAENLIRKHGIRRVAIVDFDVHHGNGTQHIFEERSDVLYISLHEHPQFLYPGSGWPGETGTAQGEGFTINIPLPPGAEDEDYSRAFRETVVPALERFQPEFLLVSAGFDAARDEDISHIHLTEAGFRFMSEQLVTVAKGSCAGRLVSVLEGGYHLESLARCATAHVTALLEASADG